MDIFMVISWHFGPVSMYQHDLELLDYWWRFGFVDSWTWARIMWILNWTWDTFNVLSVDKHRIMSGNEYILFTTLVWLKLFCFYWKNFFFLIYLIHALFKFKLCLILFYFYYYCIRDHNFWKLKKILWDKFNQLST